MAEATQLKECLRTRAIMANLSLDLRLRLKEVNENSQECHLSQEHLSQRDSSLKRNTAFVKKLRMLSPDQGDSLKTEFAKLRLSKYISEAVSVLLENRFKSSNEYALFLEICTLFNQDYSEFSAQLQSALYSLLDFGKDFSGDHVEDNFSRQRTYIRLLIELNAIRVIRDEFKVHEILKNILEVEESTGFKVIPLAAYILKHTKALILDGTGGFFSLECCTKNSVLLNGFFRMMSRFLIRSHGKLQSIEVRGKYHYENRGDLSERQTEVWAETKKFVDSLKSNLTVLADLIGQSLPVLDDHKESPKIVEGKIVFTDNTLKNADFANAIYESEEDRSFYEDSISLTSFVPQDILPKLSAETLTNDPADLDLSFEVPDINPDTAFLNVSGQALNAEPNSFDTFLSNFQAMHTSAMADKVAVEFCFVASKHNKKCLPDAIMEISKSRSDLLPFISRFLAAIKPAFPEIVDAINESLLGQFRFLLHKTDAIRGTRSRICRFIGELTKFKVMSHSKAYLCLRKAVEEFNLYNVDMVCMLLETCGRFLSLQPESHARMENIKEIIIRKKNSGLLDQNRILMIENALFIMRPLTQRQLPNKPKKTAIELFICKLLRTDLNSENSETIFSLLLKLNWEDPVVRSTLLKLFFKVWKIKDSSLSSLAAIIGGLQKIHPYFVLQLIDSFTDDFIRGMELNSPSGCHRRLSVTKVLCELYNFGVIDADVIVELLKSLLSYGHVFGIARISYPSLVDEPNDLFRVRLICTVLQSVGQYFLKGPLRPTLDKFMIYFQYYICTKQTMNFEIENLLEETLESLDLEVEYETLEKALPALLKVSPELEFLKEDLEGLAPGYNTGASVIEDVLSKSGEGFEEDFDKILAGTVEQGILSRKLEKKPQKFEAALPLYSREKNSPNADHRNEITFRLLMKKKNKPVTKSLKVPLQASLLDNILEERIAQEAEMEAVRKKTLEFHLSADDAPSNDSFLTALKQIPPPSRSDFNKAPTRRRFYLYKTQRK